MNNDYAKQFVFFKEKIIHQCPWVGWRRNQMIGQLMRLHSQLLSLKPDYLLRWSARFTDKIDDNNPAKPVYQVMLDQILQNKVPSYDALIAQTKHIVETRAVDTWRPDKPYGFLAHLEYCSVNLSFGFGDIENELRWFLLNLLPEQPSGKPPTCCQCLNHVDVSVINKDKTPGHP